MNIDKKKKNLFYATKEMNKNLLAHRKMNRLTTSKQIRMMVNFIFNNEDLLAEFNNYVVKTKKEA